jgi:uncharacterized membrane protein
MATTQLRERRLTGLLGLLVVSGILHLVMPKPYERIVPPRLGNARRIVLVSGVAELGCAALLAVPQTRRQGALASAALFVGVFPANLYAVKTMRNKVLKAGAIARLPLQIPMIAAALKVARDAR